MTSFSTAQIMSLFSASAPGFLNKGTYFDAKYSKLSIESTEVSFCTPISIDCSR